MSFSSAENEGGISGGVSETRRDSKKANNSSSLSEGEEEFNRSVDLQGMVTGIAIHSVAEFFDNKSTASPEGIVHREPGFPGVEMFSHVRLQTRQESSFVIIIVFSRIRKKDVMRTLLRRSLARFTKDRVRFLRSRVFSPIRYEGEISAKVACADLIPPTRRRRSFAGTVRDTLPKIEQPTH